VALAGLAHAVYGSKPVTFGKIRNISLGGLAFRYAGTEQRTAESFELDILFVGSGFWAEKLPYKIVSDIETTSMLAVGTDIRIARVQLGNLTSDQISQLEAFIKDHTSGEL
jgi:hypothetical protein